MLPIRDLMVCYLGVAPTAQPAQILAAPPTFSHLFSKEDMQQNSRYQVPLLCLIRRRCGRMRSRELFVIGREYGTIQEGGR